MLLLFFSQIRSVLCTSIINNLTRSSKTCQSNYFIVKMRDDKNHPPFYIPNNNYIC